MRSWFVALLLLAWTIACTSEAPTTQSTPEEATKGFFTALSEGDYDLAQRYATTSTQESVQNFATNLKMVSAEEKSDLEAPFQIAIDRVDCTNNQGNTTCVILYANQTEVRVDLVQQNDQWFIQMDLNF